MRPKRSGAVQPPFDPAEISLLGQEGIFLGTSSWKYRGWEGTIYPGAYGSEADFQRDSLKDYGALLPCVGLDATYFSWPRPDSMAQLLEGVPESFLFCPKVTQAITSAGPKNSDFLNADAFREKFLAPLELLRGRIGVVHFEFTGSEIGPLREFFSRIPRDLSYAVEVRSPELVSRGFYSFLLEANLSPAFNFSAGMPTIRQQWSAYLEAGGDGRDSPVLALALTRPGRTSEEAARLFQPYRETRDVYKEGRQDLADLALWAKSKKRKIFGLIHNHFEGSAPHTISGIAELLQTKKVEPVSL